MNHTQGGLRSAFTIALVVAFAAGGLLFQNNVGSSTDQTANGGKTSGQQTQTLQDLTVSTPTPTPLSTGESHSSAVLQAPGQKGGTDRSVPDRFPPEGHYVYSVDGKESAPPFGARDYAPEVTMTVSRPQDTALKPYEIAFDLPFSTDHTEREIVSYRTSGVSFTFESSNITFGPGVSEQDEATYDPPILQVPFPLKAGEVTKGKSTATASDGTETRVEDWTVSVLRQETIKVLGRSFKTWVVRVDRQSEPGSSQDVHKTRMYWFSQEGNIWLRWTENVASSRRFGPGAFDYTSDYTATLSRFEPK